MSAPVCQARLQLFYSGSQGDVCSLQTLGAARHFELNSGTFVQTSITLRLNRGEMNEYVFAVFSLNEAIPFGCVKPLHCAFFFHLCFLYAVMRMSCAVLRIKKQKGIAAGLHRQPPSNQLETEHKSQTRF